MLGAFLVTSFMRQKPSIEQGFAAPVALLDVVRLNFDRQRSIDTFLSSEIFLLASACHCVPDQPVQLHFRTSRWWQVCQLSEQLIGRSVLKPFCFKKSGVKRVPESFYGLRVATDFASDSRVLVAKRSACPCLPDLL